MAESTAARATAPGPGDAPLPAWLGDLPLAAFAARHLGRCALARPGSTVAARALLDWSVLARVLAARAPDADVLVVARGRLLPLPPPRDLRSLRRLLDAGIGLCVRDAERCDLGLARLVAGFAALGRARVQLFVTPRGSWGFGWHYDDEDVFIAQTLGVKDYAFRANTVADEPPAPAAFAKLARETSTPLGATLVAGDFLYLPRRWWHRAWCRDEALSISVGVTVHDGAPRARSGA